MSIESEQYILFMSYNVRVIHLTYLSVLIYIRRLKT